MAQKKRSNGRKKTVSKSNTELAVVLGVLLVVLLAVSIYFPSNTGFLGRYVGGFFYQMFGSGTVGIPVLVLAVLIPFSLGKMHGKLARTILYLGILFLCYLLIQGTLHSSGGQVQTVVELAMERGLKHVGPGAVGAVLCYALQRVIGTVGIYVLTVLLAGLFILHLIDMPLSQFLKRIANGMHVFLLRGGERMRAAREKGKAHREARRLEQKKAEEERVCEQKAEFSAKPVQGRARAASASEIQEETTESAKSIRINNYAAELAGEQRSVSEATGSNNPLKASMRNAEKSCGEGDAAHDDIEKRAADEDRKALRNEPMAPTQPVSLSRAFGSNDQLSVEHLGIEIAQEPILYTPPPIELLKLPKRNAAADKETLLGDAEIIERTLRSFGIESEVVSIDRGPTVTCFELKPQSGVKVSRIVNLSDDLSLALASPDIRIEAPIPGKPYVGIEVPNREKDDVLLREILQTREYTEMQDGLPIALGKSISGEPMIAKIAKMPHLLIAGATGSGKSVCINAIILSILYKYTPQDVRMILIDPKVVELSVYGEIPHLLIPVVTDPRKASKALYMAVQEMERRFRLFSEHSVRDISGYREKAEIDDDLENLPFIIVIIDELSDLMMVASKDVEAHITRLAQMARACGIHLIIATQRPSVDVITGTIKANIPSRISFQVSSSIDSRTILDMAGAEKLLGKGDMLYYPSTFSKPQRVQGAFISDGEVSHIIEYIKEKNTVCYDAELMASIEKGSVSAGEPGGISEGEQDALMSEVLEFISREETTSISGLQRRFRIGYSRAGRIIDELEAMGAVSPQDGSKPRNVLIGQSSLSQEAKDESAE